MCVSVEPRARSASRGWLRFALTALVACGGGGEQPPIGDPLVRVPPRPEPVAGGAASVSAPDAGVLGDGGSAGAAGAGPGGAGGNGGAGAAEQFCDAVSLVFIPRCGGGSCHNRPDATIADFAVGPEEAASYVDVPSARNAACGFIIDSNDPGESFIYRKLVGDFPAPMCGGFMPVSGGDLTDQQIDCVADWVRQFQR